MNDKRFEMFDSALSFAQRVHRGSVRKSSVIPYLLHPMEVATVVASMTDDIEVISAALLHDTVEDAGADPAVIKAQFGERVAALVASETENKRPGTDPSLSWEIRKAESLEVLKNSEDIGVKILWLGDKLANMRSFYRAYLAQGSALWNGFNQKDPAKQAWYYRSVADYTSCLAGYHAWREYNELVNTVFEDIG